MNKLLVVVAMEQLMHAIVDGAASRRAGERTLRTIDGKHALELARGYPRTATMNFK